jgi:hypothetical protein
VAEKAGITKESDSLMFVARDVAVKPITCPRLGQSLNLLAVPLRYLVPGCMTSRISIAEVTLEVLRATLETFPANGASYDWTVVTCRISYRPMVVVRAVGKRARRAKTQD